MNRGKQSLRIACSIVVFTLAGVPSGFSQGRFRILSAKSLKRAVPRDFYLEGSAVPVEKRNATLIETPSGAKVLIGLLVTSGYASQLPQKYSGMLISEGSLSVCGNPVAVGSYGFGLHRSAASDNADAEFVLYNQAGQAIWDCAARKDLRLREPRPLQVILGTHASARLYLGRYWAELEPSMQGAK